MRWILVCVACFTVAAAGMHAQSVEPKTEAPRPISSLGWLVGGVWTADASKLGPGMQRIETRYQWSDNSAFIRFTTHFISDKGTARTYDGNFFWDPAQSILAMWYMDRANEIIQGPVTVDGDSMKMTFRATDFDGKPADFQVQVLRKTGDRYQWALAEKQTDGWKQLAALEYVRVPGS
jgi:hypothetical protein